MALERVVLITGAASGIGRATALRIAAPGTALLLHTRRNAEALATVAGQALAAGAAAETMLGDLADADLPGALVARAREAFGRIDQIVSNAGHADRRRFGEAGAEALAAAQAAMPGAFFALATAALADLEASPWGRVVAVSSFVAHLFGVGGALFPTTSAAKAAVEGLARALAFQLAPTGTTVNCVAPGFTRKDAAGHSALPTDAWAAAAAAAPNGRLAEPDDVAAVIAFLLSRQARHVTGQVIHVDGGLTLR